MFFWLNIGPDTLISVSCYSDLVSWWSQNSRKMDLSQKYEKLPQMFSPWFFLDEYWSSYIYIYLVTHIQYLEITK